MSEQKTPPAAPRRGMPPGIDGFDEQRWPINLLLFLFAASLGAVIVAQGDFASERWLFNAWCHLGVLAAIVAALAWGMARLDRRVQRRMQVGVFLSLLFHLWLCMLSCNIYLSAIAHREKDAPEAFERPAPVTLPDYNWQDQATDDTTDPTLEAPVETALSETEQEVERTTPAEEPKVRPPEPEPESRPVQPMAVSVERTQMSSPRRAEELAGERLSRQELRLADSSERAALPRIDEAREQTLESPVEIERSETRLEAEPPLLETAVPASQPSRHSFTRRTQEIAPDSMAVNANSQLARATAAADARASGMSAQALPAPGRSAAKLSETRVDEVARASPSLPGASSSSTAVSDALAFVPSTTVTSSRAEAISHGAGLEPTVSASTPRAVSRRVEAAASGEMAATESPAAAATASQPRPAQPAAAAVSKASGGAAGLTRQQNFDTELPENNAATIAVSAARRPEAAQAIDPGIAAAPSEPAKIAKSRAAAETASASLPAEKVTVADAAGSARPADVEASSSAAVERRAASAPRANKTAAAGSGVIDQGAPQISSPIGDRHTSGGGEPSLSRGDTAAKVVKAAPAADARGAAPQLAADVTHAAVADPPAKPAPTVGAVGHSSASAPPTAPSSVPDALSGAAIKPSLLASVDVQRSDQRPAMRDAPLARAPAGRSRGEAAAVDGQVELGPPPQMVATTASAREPGDGEPPSARDVTRQSTAGLPNSGAATEVGDTAPATGIAAVAPAAHRSDSSPAIADHGVTGGLTRQPSVSSGTAPEASANENQIGGSATAVAAGGERMAMADLGHQRQAAALPVLVRAPSDAGGLGNEASFDVGVPSRRARPESDVVHLDAGRMILERSGGRAAELRVQDVAVPGYRQRDRQLRQELARQRGGTEGSEKAVEMGLDFLARHQNLDGSWSLQTFSQGRPGYENAGDGAMVSDTAATGLAMLAFLGAGYTHTDGKYRLVVARGLNYTLGNQRSDGDLFLPQEPRSNQNVWLYSHGIAAIALCEAYGMTRDPNLKQPAQRALDFIVAAQHPTEGGWRYAPRQGSDTSVSGWQLMALKSGELSGLRVPDTAYTKVSHWLDGAHSQGDRSKYVYRPKSTRPHQNSASRVMTAEALLMRQYLGWKRDHRQMAAGADFLMGQLPEWTSGTDWQRDSYYWYYATQVMFQMGGAHWDAWNERLRPLLVEKQVQEGPLAGSWEPLGDVPDRWGREGGRIYVTAMHLLMLEVYYRHLPLYQTLEE